jgi:PKD repeat protein
MHPALAPLGVSLALALGAASAVAQATARLVVPDLTESDGIANASTGQPFANAGNISVRVQHLYGADEFPHATPMTITRVRFRPRDYTPSTVSWAGGTYQMQIRMSTSPLTPATMSTTYANNHGANVTTVHNGAVQLLGGNGAAPGPSTPYVDLVLTTPFQYDPTQGSLVVDFLSDGALYSGGSVYFPAVSRFLQAKGARVWHTGDTTSTTGTYEDRCALVMDFDFTFAGTHADFYADEIGAPAGTPLQFFDRSITAGAGGVLSWAWDFDDDGTVDSTAQHPSHAYTAPGRYDVRLTVTANTPGGPATKVRSGYVVVGVPTASVPDLLQYQFNEVRGTQVANTATAATFPSAGIASNAGWHGDPGAGRETFGGIEPGFGSNGIAGTNDSNWVDTGAGLALAGSVSVAWWQRMDPLAPSNAWAYVFGGPGTTFTTYNRGGAYSSLQYIGTLATGNLMCLKDVHHPNWVHLCLVVDDTAGRVTWYVNGLPSGTKSYPAGTNTIANTQFLVGKHDASPTHARYYAMDDFRVYGRALSYGEVLGTMAGENASAGRYGDDCWAFGTVPAIGAIGRPQMGNASFALTFTGGGVNANQTLAVPIGFFAAAGLPVPLPGGFACGNLETSLDLLAAVVTDANGDAVLALPVPLLPALAGVHAYAQFVSTLGVTKAMDLNLQLR